MKFNFSLKGRQPAGTHYTFVKAGLPNTQWELYTNLLSLSLHNASSQPGASGQANDTLLSIRKGIRSSDPEFLAGMAIYLREQTNFGRIAFLLTAELAALPGNDEQTGLLVGRIVRNITELPAWLEDYDAIRPGQKPGRAVRKNLCALFNQLDEYQFSRSNGETQVALKKALLFLRPRATSRKQKALFGKIIKDQFPVRTTWKQEWHVLHHQLYDSPEQRQVILRDKWKEGISSFRIGYTALLDNLQPMLCTGVSGKVLKLAAEYLGNAAAVTRAGHSPLKLLGIYRSLRQMDQGGAGMLADALEQAVLHSSWSRSDFGRNVVSVIAMDISDSMKRPISAGSSVLRFDIAPLLAFLWKSRGDQVITGFVGNTWKPLELRSQPVLAVTDELRLREGEAGYATNAHLILQHLLKRNQIVDKVLVFTDSRLWDRRSFNQPAGTDLHGLWRTYRQLAPQARLYLFDLAGYGHQPLECHDEDVFLISGWSDQVFDVLQALEEGKTTVGTMNNVR